MVRKLAWIAVLVGLVFAAREGWERFQAQYGEKEARGRIEGMLAAAAKGDEQTALCQWAEGQVMLPSDAISGYFEAYTRFANEAKLKKGMRWKVVEVHLSPGESLVLAEINGNALRLLVPARRPIKLAE